MTRRNSTSHVRGRDWPTEDRPPFPSCPHMSPTEADEWQSASHLIGYLKSYGQTRLGEAGVVALDRVNKRDEQLGLSWQGEADEACGRQNLRHTCQRHSAQ